MKPETQGRMQCDDAGRDWSSAATNQGTSGAVGGWRKQGGIPPWRLQKGHGSALISDF